MPPGSVEEVVEVRPGLVDAVRLAVGHERPHRFSDVDEWVMPGSQDQVLVNVASRKVAAQGVVKGERVVDLVPSVLAKPGKVVVGVGFEEHPASGCRFGVDEHLVEALVGRPAREFLCSGEGLAGSVGAVPNRPPCAPHGEAKRDDRHG